MNLEPLTHLSYSSIALFRECPEAWRRKYLGGEREPATPPLVFGSALHGTLQSMALQFTCQRQEWSAEEIFAAQWQTTLDATPSIAWGLEEPARYLGLGQRIAALRETADVLRRIGLYFDTDHPVIERKVEWRIPGVGVPVIGFVDLLAADGVPCDFKTASKPWTQEKAEAEVQPTFYLAALRQMGYRANPLGLFRHVVFTKGTRPTVTVFETRRTQEDVVALESLVREVWHEILAARFPLNPYSWRCSQRFCHYWATCPGGGGTAP